MFHRLAILPIILAVAACAAGVDEPTPSPEPTADMTDPNDPTPAATGDQPEPGGELLTGTLGVDAIEGGCPYLEDADGTRFEVIYPPGWSADRSSGRLRDPAGNVVAHAGAEITVRGALTTGMASICQIGPIFEAREVVSASGQ